MQYKHYRKPSVIAQDLLADHAQMYNVYGGKFGESLLNRGNRKRLW